MSETKTQFTEQEIEQYMKENNLEVFSNVQMCAKIMELEKNIKNTG